MNIYFLILGGGHGQRLWPLSRKDHPKPLISFLNNKSLLQDTVERINDIELDNKKIGIVTDEKLSYKILKLVGDKVDLVLKEPCSRNTAPAILYSCLKVKEREDDSIIVFLPADSFVKEGDKYRTAIENAINYVSLNDKIVTLGVMPTRAATGYGYIQANIKDGQTVESGKIYNVVKFCEKPSLDLAKKYMLQSDMFWNIGVFAAKLSVFLKEFETQSPELFSSVQKYYRGEIEYDEIENISVDYALIEKSNKVSVLPCDFEWSDVGNLDVFLSLQQEFSVQNNVTTINIESENNLVKINSDNTNKKVVSFIGVSDLCLVQDNDIILVAKRSEVEKVKRVLNQIRKQSLESFL